MDGSWLTGGEFRFVGFLLDARSGTSARLDSWRWCASGLGREGFAKETGFSPQRSLLQSLASPHGVPAAIYNTKFAKGVLKSAAKCKQDFSLTKKIATFGGPFLPCLASE